MNAQRGSASLPAEFLKGDLAEHLAGGGDDLASMFPVHQSSSANSWLVLICAANLRMSLRLTPNC